MTKNRSSKIIQVPVGRNHQKWSSFRGAFPTTEDTDLESMVLAQNKEFWRLMDRAHKEGEKKGFTKLEELPD